MKRLAASMIAAALLAGASSFMIARAQQDAPALIAGDQPVTAEQVVEKLKSDGWSSIVVSRSGRYLRITGFHDGQAGKLAVDSQTGRLSDDDDDDDDD